MGQVARKLSALVLVVAAGAVSGACHRAPSPAKRPQVLAFYYPWYGMPPVSPAWVHWNAGGHNPEVIDAQGLRDIASAHHPSPDTYDANDAAVISRHLQLAQQAGIDGLIASWWGANTFEDIA